MKINLILLAMIGIFLVLGCNSLKNAGGEDSKLTGVNGAENKKMPETTEVTDTTGTKLTPDGFVIQETGGTAKETPEAGKANVQGKVFYNSEPAKGVDVMLCEKFSTFSGCGGKKYTTKTDDNGEYLFKNVEAMTYESLPVKVFNTRDLIFMSNRFGITPAKYKVEADETFFAPPTNLYKFDLKAESPKQKAKVDAKDLEFKWQPYENAAYYKISMYPKDTKTTAPYVGEKVEGESFKPDKTLTNGDYRVRIDAYNANDVKLAQTDKDIEFTVTGGEEAPANTETK